MSDWIEWKGGECPVSDETLIDVKWHGAPVPDIGVEAGRSKLFQDSWSHEGPAWRRIVAYRLHVPREAFEARISDLEHKLKVAEEALVVTRAIVSEGALEGFNPLRGGDWATRLYENNGNISAALSLIRGEAK